MIKIIDNSVVAESLEEIMLNYLTAYNTANPEKQMSFEEFAGTQTYVALYSAAQVAVETDTAFLQSIYVAAKSNSYFNQVISRPAVLESMLGQFFRDNVGYDASIKNIDTVAEAGQGFICVDYTTDAGGPEDSKVAHAIINFCLPAGVFLNGAISYDVAIANGQLKTARWNMPTQTDVEFRVTVWRDRNVAYPDIPVETIIEIFEANWAEKMHLGNDITPEFYLNVDELPFAAKVLVEYDRGVTGTWSADVYLSDYTDKHIPILPPANVTVTDL